MHKLLFTLTLLAVASLAHGQAPSATTAREIAALFRALETSGCEFNRNGSWYDAAKASEHLRGKYDYLVKKELIDSTESFIARGASESSFSGKAYQVRCPGKTTVDSDAWFHDQLIRFRKGNGQ